MSVVQLSEIEDLETRLEAEHTKLATKLRGEELTPEMAELYSDTRRHINDRDLRIAIDNFAVILKELKRICK